MLWYDAAKDLKWTRLTAADVSDLLVRECPLRGAAEAGACCALVAALGAPDMV